jgi:eukaryotic-like serine/threonine-protein kinase
LRYICCDMKKAFQFIIGNFYLRNLSLVIILSIILIVLTFSFLRVYTHHGQAMSVPNLFGLTEKEAATELEKRELKYLLIDSVYITTEKKGVVVDQIPKPEYKVKKDRTIFLTINSHTPEKVVMTDLIGFSYRQAQFELNNRGLEIGRLIPVPDIKKGMVLRQKINGSLIMKGDTILKGSKIDLEIGDGNSNERVTVPDLINMNVVQAKNKLNSLYLNMADIFDNTVLSREDTLHALAFRQKPEASKWARLPLGSFVDVWFTIDSTKMPGYDSLLQVKQINENDFYGDDEN